MSKNLVAGIRASLNAKLERLLARPLVARIVDPASWREDPNDGTCSVRAWIDYDDKWRGREKEVLESVTGTLEGAVTFLTDRQKVILEASPREFLALDPPPESAELVSFKKEHVLGAARVVEFTVAAAPESPKDIQHLAIVPNMVQIERQLQGLGHIEAAAEDGPIAPLRALLGIRDASSLRQPPPAALNNAGAPPVVQHLDEYQVACVEKALATPHFAVIHGPPGSGKTTVISSIIRHAIARGDRILVVSPTHVAVDNVVEKIGPPATAAPADRLEPRTLPVRYAARPAKLSPRAMDYWIGRKKERRGATIATRVQQRLVNAVPFAQALFAIEDKDATGKAPISSAVASVQEVICGTPIGILSFEAVKRAEPAAFGLLIVDEVSKMTLPEFLAIAVKARRWVLVGDPQQLPPYNDADENGTTLDDILDRRLELICSVATFLGRVPGPKRATTRLAVVCADPRVSASALRAHLGAARLDRLPSIEPFGDGAESGVILCTPDCAQIVCDLLARFPLPEPPACPDEKDVPILVERGITLARPQGTRAVETRVRAQAAIFDASFGVYHSRPWGHRSGQELRSASMRSGFGACLPSAPALESLGIAPQPERSTAEVHAALTAAIAERLAINTVSVYDWITGIPAASFDESPLRELGALSAVDLSGAVEPYVGTLKKQYRMHASLSKVPRELFYFGQALHDGKQDEGCRVHLVQVTGQTDDQESNGAEAKVIAQRLRSLSAFAAAHHHRPDVMIITPYRSQEALLATAIEELRMQDAIAMLDVEVCTLDRCQGREAGYVMISLVRGRSSAFLDMPKRWNVALTRAKDGLFIFGNIAAYLDEAEKTRRTPLGSPLRMSLLARILQAYDRQLADHRRGTPR